MIIQNMKLFAGQLGWRLVVLFVLLLFAGLAEGFGVSMILPLLQSDIGESDNALSRIISGLFNLLAIPTHGTNILILLVIFFVIRAVLLVGQTWYQAVILSNHLSFMRGSLIRSVLKADYLHLTRYDAGYLTNAIVREVQAVNAGLRNLIDLMVALVMAAIYITLPILLQPVLTLFLIALAIPIAGLSAVMIRKTRRASIQFTELHGRQESFLIEGVRNAKFVKATGRVPIISDRMTNETDRVSLVFRKLFILGGITRYAPEPLVVIVMAGIIFVYTRGFDEPITEVLFLMFLFFQSAKNMLRIQSTLRQFIEATGSLLLHNKLKTDLDANAVLENPNAIAPDLGAEITLSKVSVTYPDAASPALRDANISIPNRSTVALVGASGSGKTTVANLVCGLIAPTTGSIALGNDQYSTIQLSELQKSVGYVTQESAVFNGTLAENVTFWEQDPDRERVDDILNQLELRGIGSGVAEDDIAEHIIGGDGAQLSGGERQRLSIARELYRHSTLLILDEATSALDSALEQKIDQLLEEQRGNRTFLIIAHRLSTVKNADIIYVLDDGEVIESGSFDELVESDGQFAKMVRLQSF
jgi:subfamily B ATP-binding cassette protein MsbA